MNEKDIKELAKLLVDVVNEESNNYDAIESIEDILRITFKEEEEN